MLDLSGRQRLYLWLSAIFLTALLIGDTIGSKLFTFAIPLGFTTLHATLSVGAIWFPITFLLTDVINEFYGSRGARLVTWVGFVMAIFAFIAIFVARAIPAASFSPVRQPDFENVLGNANRIFVASLIAYLIGQLVDITIFQAAKKLTQSRHIWLRSTGSTVISQFFDTVVVTFVAFMGKVSTVELRHMIVTSYIIKLLAAIGLTPVIYALHALLHDRLHVQEEPAVAQRVHEPIP